MKHGAAPFCRKYILDLSLKEITTRIANREHTELINTKKYSARHINIEKIIAENL